MKMDLWEEIGEAVSVLGVRKRTGAPCKKNYCNLISLAKITHNKHIIERKKMDLRHEAHLLNLLI